MYAEGKKPITFYGASDSIAGHESIVRPFKMGTPTLSVMYTTHSELSCQPSQCISHHLADSVLGPRSLSISPWQPTSSLQLPITCSSLFSQLPGSHAILLCAFSTEHTHIIDRGFDLQKSDKIFFLWISAQETSNKISSGPWGHHKKTSLVS